MQADDEASSREEQSGKNKDPGILTVSVFGGAIGAICCLMVPLLVSLGSAGAVVGSVDAFASLRPYLIAGAWVLALLVVVYAVYRQVRRPAAGCEAGDGCEPKESDSDLKIQLQKLGARRRALLARDAEMHRHCANGDQDETPLRRA